MIFVILFLHAYAITGKGWHALALAGAGSLLAQGIKPLLKRRQRARQRSNRNGHNARPSIAPYDA